MELKEVKNTGIKYLEICGVGENISDSYKRVYFSKSGAEIVGDEINSEKLNKLELYFNKNNKAVLTAKKDEKTITFNDYVNSSYRGTSWIEEVKNGVVESATGAGRLGEHTELIASLKDGGYLIVGFNGRYEAGYKIYQNKNGKLITNVFANEGKYVDMFPIEEAKALAGINEICELTKNNNMKKKAELLRGIFNDIEIIDECGEERIKVRTNGLEIIISDVKEIKNEN